MTSAESANGLRSRSQNSAGVKIPVLGKARESTAFWNVGRVSGLPASRTVRRARPRCAHTSSIDNPDSTALTIPMIDSTGHASLVTRRRASRGRRRSFGSLEVHSPADVRPVDRSTSAHPAADQFAPRSRCTAISVDDEDSLYAAAAAEFAAAEFGGGSRQAVAPSVAWLITSVTARFKFPPPPLLVATSSCCCCCCCMYSTTENPASTSIGTYFAMATRGTPPNAGLVRDTCGIDLFLRVACTPSVAHTLGTSAPRPRSQS